VTAARALVPGDVVGLVGLGRMGSQMAARLHAAGFVVRGYDVDDAARRRYAEEHGGTCAGSLQELGEGAAAVLVVLPTSAVVRTVLVDDGLLDALPDGALLVDMGSSQPEVTRELAAAAGDAGVRLLDAPVSGGVKGAREGTLTIMVGGPAEWIQELQELLEVLGTKTVHVGPVGSAHALKALNNLLSASHLLATSEALAIGARFGLDPQTMIDAINGSSGKSWSSEMKFPTYVLPGTFASGFALGLLVKDVRIAVELATSTGTPAAHAEATLALWEQAARELPGEPDHTEIARWVQGRTSDGASGERRGGVTGA
jgi:3-hydroxyisobutyrate dehydrogenase